MSFLQILAGSTWEQGNFSAGLRSLSDKLKQREAFRDLLLPVEVHGEHRWWEMTASPRLDEEGRFIGFRGVGSDVTERRASTDRINRMARRSEEHTSELQSLMRISYAVFCLKKKKQERQRINIRQ